MHNWKVTNRGQSAGTWVNTLTCGESRSWDINIELVCIHSTGDGERRDAAVKGVRLVRSDMDMEVEETGRLSGYFRRLQHLEQLSVYQ